MMELVEWCISAHAIEQKGRQLLQQTNVTIICHSVVFVKEVGLFRK